MCLAVPGRILSIAGDDALTRVGRVDFGGIVREANLAYTPEARIGDYVLVHVGFAISVIDEVEARRVFEHLGELEEPDGAGAASEPAAPEPAASEPDVHSERSETQHRRPRGP